MVQHRVSVETSHARAQLRGARVVVEPPVPAGIVSKSVAG